MLPKFTTPRFGPNPSMGIALPNAAEVTPGIDVTYARAQPGYTPLYTFTLPASWTHGTIDLTAVVNPPDVTPALLNKRWQAPCRS